MEVRFIDLFAGIGGTRLGFEQACKAAGHKPKCVFTSEIKPFAIEIYKHNFSEKKVTGDITAVDARDIPDFDFLLAGFPCQAFSAAGSRRGFMDTRGTLFFDIERILKAKKPKGFLTRKRRRFGESRQGRQIKTLWSDDGDHSGLPESTGLQCHMESFGCRRFWRSSK